MTSKRELACRMLPAIDPKSAVNRMNIWIKQNPELMEKLRELRYHKCQKYLTPAQARVIEEYLVI